MRINAFLVLAKGRAAEARVWLDQAVLADPALRDAWFKPGASQALQCYLPLARGADRARAEAVLRQRGSS